MRKKNTWLAYPTGKMKFRFPIVHMHPIGISTHEKYFLFFALAQVHNKKDSIVCMKLAKEDGHLDVKILTTKGKSIDLTNVKIDKAEQLLITVREKYKNEYVKSSVRVGADFNLDLSSYVVLKKYILAKNLNNQTGKITNYSA